MRPHKELLSDYEIICIIQHIKALWPEEIRKKHRELFTRGKGDANPP